MKVSIAFVVTGAETPRASVDKINGVVRPRAKHYMVFVKEITVIPGDIAFLDIKAERSWIKQDGGAVRDVREVFQGVGVERAERSGRSCNLVPLVRS